MEYVKRCGVCSSERIRSVDARICLCACADCGFVFRSPRPDAAEIAAFYSCEGRYGLWLGEERARDLLWRRRLALVGKYAGKGALLDVGAGTGQFLRLASGRFDVFGTEVSASAVRIARERYGIELVRGGLEDLDFGSRRFDVITAFHVLEHVGSPARLLERCRRLLAKDGVMVIAVPNELNSFAALAKMPVKRFLSALGLLRGRYGAYGLRGLDLGKSLDEIHLSFFTAASLRRLLAACGFAVIDEAPDPYFASTGLRRLADRLSYAISLGIRRIFGVNLYGAILVAAKPDK
jgi:SAM-dependent methyltransferase